MKIPVSRAGLDADELRHLIVTMEADLRSLAGSAILITGATGWFGVWLLDVLCSADDLLGLGIQICAVSRDPQNFLNRFPGFSGDGRITWIESDVRQLRTHGNFTYIIHAATDTVASAAPDASLQLFGTIVDGTRRVIEAAGEGCRGFLLLSSGAIYGPARADRERFCETDDGGPDPASVRSAYAEGKRSAELLAVIASTLGVPVNIARCFAFVGPHMPFDKHFAIGNFIADAVAGRPVRIKSDGRPLRSYLYMTDLVRALVAILTRGACGRAYNVGSDIAVSIEQIARCVDHVVGGCGVIIEGAPSSPGDRYVPDTSRLREELNFIPEIALDSAISRTAAWYRARELTLGRS